MQQKEYIEKLCLELLKQIGIGFNSSRIYPPGHPLFERIAETSMDILRKFPPNYKSISFYFLENIVLFEELRIDTSKLPAVVSLIKHFIKSKIESITIDRDARKEDWKAFYQVLALPVKKLLETDDPTEYIFQKGGERIRLNEVKFSLTASDQEKEIKIDFDTLTDKIEKGEFTRTDLIEGIPGETVTEKIASFVKEGNPPPTVVSRIFGVLNPEETEEILLKTKEKSDIGEKLKEIIAELPEKDLIFLLSNIKKENIKDIIEILPQDKREKIENIIPSLLTGTGKVLEIERRVEKLIKNFGEIPDPQKEKEIVEILDRMTGINIKSRIPPKELPNLMGALRIVAAFLIEKYGEEGFSDYTLLISHILKILAPEIKSKFLSEAEKYKEIAGSIREILSTMDDKELVSLISEIREGGEEIPLTIKEILEQRKFYKERKGETPSYQEKEMQILDRIAREKHLVITGEKKLKFIEKELAGGIGASEIEKVVKPLLEKIESEESSERKTAVQALIALVLSFLESEKFSVFEFIMEVLKEKIYDEEHPEVIFVYIDGLEKILDLAKKKKLEGLVEDSQKTFRDLLDSDAKKKFAIKALGKTGTAFAVRMLLTTLWDDEIEEELKEAFLSAGKKGFEALKEVFPEVENLKVRKRIAKFLASFPREYRKTFYEGLEEKGWTAQRDAAFILGESRDKDGIPFLLNLLKKGQDIVRIEAAKALAKIESPEAEEDLIEVYKKYPSQEVKEECLKAILKIGTQMSVDVVKEYIDSVFKEGKIKALFIPSLVYLLEHSPHKVFPYFKKILFEKTLFKKPKFPSEIRNEVIRILVNKRGKEVASWLKELSKDPDVKVRNTAIFALRKLGYGN